MTYTKLEFMLFMVTTVMLLLLNQNNNYRKTLLLIASCYFYAYYDYRFLALLAVPIFVDFNIGKAICRSKHAYQRKIWLVTSLTVNLGILLVFKYCNFFIQSFQPLLELVGVNARTLDLILPLGISFYTFKTLSYIIDVYYGKIEPCSSLMDYALFICFFPTLLAGPIIRASSFLPQLRSAPSIKWKGVRLGFRLFAVGLFKKVFIADNLAAFVDAFYANPTLYDTTTTWLGVFAYSLQIYFDFSGYSDMAIGSSLLLGYQIETNFNFPYISRSIREFWRRWHITLSTWIRDYIYIPLGGSRKGNIRAYSNLLVAMLLCGLWHGAGWTFVIWGGFHGVALIIERILQHNGLVAEVNEQTGIVSSIIRCLITLSVVTVGWIFFRSPDFATAVTIIERLVLFAPGVSWYPPFTISVILCTTTFHLIRTLKPLDERIMLPENAWYTPFIIFCLLWLVILFSPNKFIPEWHCRVFLAFYAQTFIRNMKRILSISILH